MLKRIVAIVFVYLIAVGGWVFLAGTITYRTENQDQSLKREVGQLWGTPLEQRAPWAKLHIERTKDVYNIAPKTHASSISQVVSSDDFDVPIVSNSIHTRFNLD